MKALLLLLLRITTGGLLVVWGLIKLNAPAAAIGVSDKYYSSIISAEAMQTPLGVAQIVLGALVILGVLRRITYPAQAIILVIGAAAIWKYLIDPLGMYLLDESSRQVLFFPSSTVAVASLILLAFKSDDRFALDNVFDRS